jgi:hypothetical protein
MLNGWIPSLAIGRRWDGAETLMNSSSTAINNFNPNSVSPVFFNCTMTYLLKKTTMKFPVFSVKTLLGVATISVVF